jgi:hypothetical protein
MNGNGVTLPTAATPDWNAVAELNRSTVAYLLKTVETDRTVDLTMMLRVAAADYRRQRASLLSKPALSGEHPVLSFVVAFA